eukprot:CAMPEP_0198288676 /NCGR_PEP_ID=MMETSP1449-20131203/7098_1 /TAXON_ID=420275 /ORGANISM="Attheya septentrionalis, Strain CCMP2084" /LENGTH=380 /DNA_ID=CAMNT_0043986867 /DNA_START=151 /DNA_END=1293 /DNA_ORIENTATION=-
MSNDQEPETKAETMRAVQGKDYGDIDEMLSVQDDVRVPYLADLPPKKRNNFLKIRTMAVSLAPGDCRVLSGKTRELQGPPSMPYVPCGDCCGIVVELPPENPKKKLPFKVGDRVAARFLEGPRDALGEYALVHQAVCDVVPEEISSDEAAALAGASPAVALADRIKAGERVLILGASGGVGSHVCQLIRKERGASYIAGVSRNCSRLLEAPLAYDKAVDYTKEDPWSIPEWTENPFDVIIDLAGGGWLRILQGVKEKKKSIVKPASAGGRFLTITPDDPIFELHTVWGALKLFVFPPLWRYMYSRTWSRSNLPAYSFAMSLPGERQVMTRTLKFASEGKMKACIDPAGPFPFTTDGVRAAFRLQESRHPQGKVVVHVADK